MDKIFDEAMEELENKLQIDCPICYQKKSSFIKPLCNH